MALTFFYDFTRDNGEIVTVEYADKMNGRSGGYFEPDEPSEREVIGTLDPIPLTEPELERLDAEVASLPENEWSDDVYDCGF